MKTASGIELTEREIAGRKQLKEIAEKMTTKTGKPLSPEYIERLSEYADATDALLNTPQND